jgi:Skp family chaperone for outer membrane proteins
MKDEKVLQASINECEGKIAKMKKDLDSYYDALESKVAPLVKESEEKEAQKKAIVKNNVPAFLWAIIAVLAIGAIVVNAIGILWLRGVLFFALIGVGVYTFMSKSKLDKKYNGKVAVIDKELDDIQDKIEKIYDSDPRIAKTEKAIEDAEKELKKLKSDFADIEVLKKISENNLIIYCSFVGIGDNKCFPVIDGVEHNAMPDNLYMYYLNPGDHTAFVNIVRSDGIFDIEDINFHLDGSNKYIYIKHDMRTYEFETKHYDSFDEFAANFGDAKRVQERLVRLVEKNG